MPSPVSSDLTAALLAAKKAKRLTFTQTGEAIGRNGAWVALLFYRQATASLEEASTLIGLLGLEGALADALQEYPTKGSLDLAIPTDPLIYRF